MVQRIKRIIIKLVNIIFSSSKSEINRGTIDSPSPVNNLSSETILQLAQKYSGKLLLRDEIFIHDIHFSKLLQLQLFTPVKSFQKTFFYTRCKRCNNGKNSLLSYIHCERCQTKHLYCRNCIMMGRVLECEPLYKWSGIRYPWPKHKNPCTWNGQLTYAQNEAAKLVEQAVLNKSEILVWAVTGAGKTEILFKGIALALTKGERICIATPRADVVRELLPRIQSAFSSVQVQGLYGKSRDREATAQLIIATTHQLMRFYEAFDVMIIDEIDAFPYNQDDSLQFATKRASKRISTKVYLTATPQNSLKRKISQKKLDCCFVPIRYHQNPLPVPRLLADYSLQKQLNNNRLPKLFIQWLNDRKHKNRQILIFVPTIQLAENLQHTVATLFLDQHLIKHHSQLVSVHAEDPYRERKIKLFREKKIYALITTTILERGVTFPSVDVVVLQASHEVFNEAALVQIAGRAGRNKLDPTGDVIFIHDGKTNAIVDAVLSIKKMNRRGKKMLLTIKGEKQNE